MAIQKFYKSDDLLGGSSAAAYRDRKEPQNQGNPVQVFLAAQVLCGAFFALQAMTMALSPLGFAAVTLGATSGHVRRLRKMGESLTLG